MMTAPTVAPDKPADAPDTLADVSAAEYLSMVDVCLPIQKSEYMALLYMRAEISRAGDVRVKKAQFMKAAGKLNPGDVLPPMTDAALRIVAAPKLLKQGH